MTQKPTEMQEQALARLAGAMADLQAAGLTVKAGNEPLLGLVLAIGGARVTADSFGVMRFEPGPPDLSAEARRKAGAPAASLAQESQT